MESVSLNRIAHGVCNIFELEEKYCFFLGAPDLESMLYDIKRELLELSDEKGGPVICKVRAIIADAPMRAALKNVVPFNSYYACERCLAK
jgi:hypothetical protein